MNIAICDDDTNDLNELTQYIKDFNFNNDLMLFCYSSASDLFLATSKIDFDIAILDIEMPEPNGFEIAKKLQKLQKKPLILFVTNSMEYTIQGYGIAFRYITKPINPTLLFQHLSSALEEIQATHFFFSSEGLSFSIACSDILYFEVYSHKVTLHTKDTTYSFRNTIKGIYQKLPKSFFALPHQSYIINLYHVNSFSSSEIVMDDKSVIPISRRRVQNFTNQFYQFLRR